MAWDQAFVQMEELIQVLAHCILDATTHDIKELKKKSTWKQATIIVLP